MSLILTTGFVRVSDNLYTYIDLRGYTVIESARVRWRGKEDSDYDIETIYNSAVGTTPFSIYIELPSSIPTGWKLSSLVAKTMVFNRSGVAQTGVTAYVGTGSKNNEATGYLNSTDPNQCIQSFVTSFAIADATGTTEHGGSVFDNSPIAALMQVAAEAKLTYEKMQQSTNPSVKINSIITSYTGVLNDGVVSEWQPLAGLIANTNNSIWNDTSGSTYVDCEIEYTVSSKPTITTNEATDISYTTATLNGIVTDNGGSIVHSYFEYGTTEDYGAIIDMGVSTVNLALENVLTSLLYETTYYYRLFATNEVGTSYGVQKSFTTLYPTLPPPIKNSPLNMVSTTNRKPWFEFTMNSNFNNNALKYHAKIRISEYVGLQEAIIIDSQINQENWELWGGSEWIAFPSEGVNPDNIVRGKPLDDLQLTTLYWDIISFDGSKYGESSPPWSMRILLTVKGLYALVINGVEYDAYSLSVSETVNGQIGEIKAVINNVGGLNNSIVQFGDVVQLAVNDIFGNTEEYKGIVREKTPSGYALTITAISGSGILAERRIKVDYVAQDIGLIAKQIIDTYCVPLTSLNINTSTGIIAPISSKDKTPLSVLEDMRRQSGIMYYIDKDWDTHLYLAAAVDEAYTVIRSGE